MKLLLSAVLLAILAAVPLQDQIGTTLYPSATEMPEAAQRLSDTKSSTWLTSRVFHTDDRIKDVVKHFRDQGEKTKHRANENQLLKSLVRDNWEITEREVRYTPAIFGLSKDLRTPESQRPIKHSFGVILLDDSLVRVHLMSPHPASADNSKLVDGTMIVMIRERITDPSAAASEDEKAYTGREVTQRVRIRSKPEPDPVSGLTGVVVLKAVLSSSGKVTRITIVSGVPGLTEPAIAAARKITFDPAIKDGRYVSMWVQLEYHFR